MKKYGRDNRPNLKPVTRIELSEKNIKLRTVLIVVFLSIGAVALVTGLFQLINVEPGWQEIEVSSDQANCSGDFILMYDFSEHGGSATAANRQIIQLYSKAAEDAYKLFSPDVATSELPNLEYVNRHRNEVITVHPVLYDALALAVRYGNRSIYLAPVYAEYDRIFLSESDGEAARNDPALNPELIPYIAEAAAFANDPQMIAVELLEGNQIRLTVSAEYLAFAEEYEIDTLVDFSWMKNAFIVDYIADVLCEGGFTSGYLSSYDGFTRNLDARGTGYSVNIFDRQGNNINMPARLNYTGPMSIVFLRDYSMTEQDRWHYYVYEDGKTTSVYLDSADGMNKTAVDSLVCYGKNAGCAEMLLQMIPSYIADDFSADSLNALMAEGIYSVWCEGSVLYYNDPAGVLEMLEDSSGITYEKKLAIVP